MRQAATALAFIVLVAGSVCALVSLDRQPAWGDRAKTECGDVEAYAPRLIFSHGEQYFPVSVTGDDGSVDNNHENYDCDVRRRGQIRWGPNAGQEGWDKDNDGFPDEYVCYYRVEDVHVYYPLAWAGRYRVIQYLYYYAYNPPWAAVSFTAHEHDFEVVSVWIDSQGGRIARICASEHLWHTVASFPSRPVQVYVERGGHGMRFSPEKGFLAGKKLDSADFTFKPIAELARTIGTDLDGFGRLASGGTNEWSGDRSFFLPQGRAPWKQQRYYWPAASIDSRSILCVCPAGRPASVHADGTSTGAIFPPCRLIYTGEACLTGSAGGLSRMLLVLAGQQGRAKSAGALGQGIAPAVLGCEDARILAWQSIGRIGHWGLVLSAGAERGRRAYPQSFLEGEAGLQAEAGRQLIAAAAQQPAPQLVVGGLFSFVRRAGAGGQAQLDWWQAGLVYEDCCREVSCMLQATPATRGWPRPSRSPQGEVELRGLWRFPGGETAQVRLESSVRAQAGGGRLYRVQAGLWMHGFLSLQGGYECRELGRLQPVYRLAARLDRTAFTLTGGKREDTGFWYRLAFSCKM